MKILKILTYSFIIYWLVFIQTIVSFAQTNIIFTTDRNKYNIDDTIQLDISIQSDGNIGENIGLEWISNFQLVGKRQSTSTSIINWSQSSTFNLQITLLAEESWAYTLWPVIVREDWKDIASNTINIEVTWERIMVNNKLQNFKNNTWQLPTNNEEDDDDIDSFTLDSSSGSITPKDILWIDWELMTDIYEKKWYLLWYPFSKNSLIFLFFSFLWLIFYKLLSKYLEKYYKTHKKTTATQPIQTQKKEINYHLLLSELETKYINSSKDDFYAEASTIYRYYLEDTLWDKSSTKSFTQMQKRFPNEKKLLRNYAQVYFPEYNTHIDSTDERLSIIDNLKKIILKK